MYSVGIFDLCFDVSLIVWYRNIGHIIDFLGGLGDVTHEHAIAMNN